MMAAPNKRFRSATRRCAPAGFGLACRACTLLAGLILQAGSVSAAVLSVEELNAQADQWATLGEKKTLLTVEGRYSSISRIALKMKNCELSFKPAGAELPRLNATGNRLEVGGRMSLENGRPVFQVERLRELPSELDELKQRGRGTKADRPDDWYALAAWASGRGRFYNDEELLKAGEEHNLKALEIEREQIPRESPERFLTLAAKAARLGLPESRREELVHEGFQKLWEALRASEKPRYRELTEQMARDLPGAEVPLQPPQPKLEQKYRESPLAVFRESSSSERRKLHRILYADVLLAGIVANAKPDGSNGLAIADELERQIPESHDQAETFREKELQFRFNRIETATRSEAIALSDLYRRRNEPEKARQSLEIWLAKREPLYRKDGPDGLKQLAEEQLNLLENEKQAAELLKEAWKLSPGSEEIASRLERLGFKQKDGQWLTTQEYNALPRDPIEQAMREGRVVVGMTRDQVRKTLGAPTSVTRIVAADDTAEIWSYGPRSASRLSIQILRRSRANAESRVISVQSISP